MIDYEMSIPTRVIYGPGRHKEIGQRLKKYTTQVLFIYGGGSIRRSGLYDSITAALNSAGIQWKELAGVHANPTIEKVNEGIELCRIYNIRFLLAAGGGSVIDTAKSIAVGADYNGDVWDFYTGKAGIDHAMPIATILTVPGTGSEVSVNAILTNEKTKEKRGILNDCLRPVFSILDPELCKTLPPRQISNGVYDMFCHTFERYMSRTEHTDVVDGIGEGIMKAILKNGPVAYHDPTNLDAMGELMVASDFSHNMITGFGRKADWSCHGMEEVISGLYDIPHGAGLSVLVPGWMRYVYKKHIDVFTRFAANVMGVQTAGRNADEIIEESIQGLENFSRTLGLPLRLSELGVDDSKFEYMAQLACSYKQDGRVGRLEPLDQQDIVHIYQSVL